KRCLPVHTLVQLPSLRRRVGEGKAILQPPTTPAGAGIAIPAPGPPHPPPRLEHERRQAKPPQPMQHVEPGKSSTHDNHIECPSTGLEAGRLHVGHSLSPAPMAVFVRGWRPEYHGGAFNAPRPAREHRHVAPSC